MNHKPLRNITAIVAAGGTGSRMGLDRPKSTIDCCNHPLIHWSISPLLKLGVKRIELFVDSTYWLKYYESTFKNIDKVNVNLCSNYISTFLIFRDIWSNESEYLFTYGHAPRSIQHYRNLVAQHGNVIPTKVGYSTRKTPISTKLGEYFEPPYFIRPNAKMEKHYSSWLEFFSHNNVEPNNGEYAELNEFNDLFEYKLFINSIEHKASEFGVSLQL